MPLVDRTTTWRASFAQVFLIAALGFIFANAWNMLASTMLKKYAKKDAQGNLLHPVKQTFGYAVAISVLCALVIWYYHEHTAIRL